MLAHGNAHQELHRWEQPFAGHYPNTVRTPTSQRESSTSSGRIPGIIMDVFQHHSIVAEVRQPGLLVAHACQAIVVAKLHHVPTEWQVEGFVAAVERGAAGRKPKL